MILAGTSRWRRAEGGIKMFSVGSPPPVQVDRLRSAVAAEFAYRDFFSAALRISGSAPPTGSGASVHGKAGTGMKKKLAMPFASLSRSSAPSRPADVELRWQTLAVDKPIGAWSYPTPLGACHRRLDRA